MSRRDYSRQVIANQPVNYVLLSVAAVAMIIPIYWMVVSSLKGLNPGSSMAPPLPSEFSFDAFERVLGGQNYARWYANSLIVAGASTVLSVTLSVAAAYALARFVFPGRRALGAAMLLIQLAPGVLVAIPMYSILYNLNLLNTQVGLSAAYVTRALPFCTWMLWGFFRSLPVELEEAAMVDGANRFQVLRRVVLPLSWPGITVAAMFTFVLAWEEYLFALMIMTREQALTLTVGASRLVTTESISVGELMAYSVLMTIPVAVVFGLVQKHMVSGMTAGALKG